MNVLGTALMLANSIVFFVVGLTITVRLKRAKGSLHLAKVSIVMAAFSAAAAFLIEVILQFVYDPSNPQSWLLVRQLFVLDNLSAMLVVASLASFAVFATYSGGKRKLITLLIFVVALIPTAYLTLNYDLTVVTRRRQITLRVTSLRCHHYRQPCLRRAGSR